MADDTEKEKALKSLRPYNPVAVTILVTELALLVDVVRVTSGVVRVGAGVFALLALIGLLFGPMARRKSLRTFLIAARQVERIKAMRSQKINADDVFDAAPMTDRQSFFAGYSHAMLRVEDQMRRGVEDVDAL